MSVHMIEPTSEKGNWPKVVPAAVSARLRGLQIMVSSWARFGFVTFSTQVIRHRFAAALSHARELAALDPEDVQIRNLLSEL